VIASLPLLVVYGILFAAIIKTLRAVHAASTAQSASRFSGELRAE